MDYIEYLLISEIRKKELKEMMLTQTPMKKITCKADAGLPKLRKYSDL